MMAESSAADKSDCEIICEHRAQWVARCLPDGVPSWDPWGQTSPDCLSRCLAVRQPDCAALEVAVEACTAAKIDALVEQCGVSVCMEERDRWLTCAYAAECDAGRCDNKP